MFFKRTIIQQNHSTCSPVPGPIGGPAGTTTFTKGQRSTMEFWRMAWKIIRLRGASTWQVSWERCCLDIYGCWDWRCWKSIAGEVPNWTNWKNRRTWVAHQQHDFDATLWAECRWLMILPIYPGKIPQTSSKKEIPKHKLLVFHVLFGIF